jgi:hypothetical protein
MTSDGDYLHIKGCNSKAHLQRTPFPKHFGT